MKKNTTSTHFYGFVTNHYFVGIIVLQRIFLFSFAVSNKKKKYKNTVHDWVTSSCSPINILKKLDLIGFFF